MGPWKEEADRQEPGYGATGSLSRLIFTLPTPFLLQVPPLLSFLFPRTGARPLLSEMAA